MASFIFTAVIVLMVVILAINIVSPRPSRRRPGRSGHGSVDIFPDSGTGSIDVPNHHHGGPHHSGGTAGHHGGFDAGFGGHHGGGFGGGHHG